jgi:predicted RNA binding protein YcfA (HicA-like mRNA interferase family)
MPPLPVCSGSKAVDVFLALGWRIDRQRSSHVSMNKPGEPNLLVIPQHKELDAGLLRGLIRDAGITVSEFVMALRGR